MNWIKKTTISIAFLLVIVALSELCNLNAQIQSEKNDSLEIFNYCIENIESTNDRLYGELEYYERNIKDFPISYKDNIHETLNRLDAFYEETLRIQKYASFDDSIVFNNDLYLIQVEGLINFLANKNINDQITQPLTTISKRFEKTESLSYVDFFSKLQFTRIELLFIKQDILMMYIAGIDKCRLNCIGNL